MTPYGCAEAVAEFLKKVFEKYAATDDKIKDAGMNIYAGFLPKTASSEEKRRRDPCITIRPVRIEDTLDYSDVTLQVLVMTYCDGKLDGHRELYHILQIIRQAVETEDIIDGTFQLNYDGHNQVTNIPEEQPYPEWWGYMELHYAIRRPQQNIVRMEEWERKIE